MGTWFCAEKIIQGWSSLKMRKIHALRMPYVNEEYKLNDMGGGNEACYS